MALFATRRLVACVASRWTVAAVKPCVATAQSTCWLARAHTKHATTTHGHHRWSSSTTTTAKSDSDSDSSGSRFKVTADGVEGLNYTPGTEETIRKENHIQMLQDETRDLIEHGNFDIALETAHAVEGAVADHFGKEHPVYASAMNNLGLIYKMLGRLADASTAYLGALKVYITVCGEEHLSTAATMHNLGLLHKQLVELEPDNPNKTTLVHEAIQYLSDALRVREAELGAADMNTLSTKQALAGVLRLLDDTHMATAQKLLEETVTVCEEEHPETRATATAKNNLAYHLKLTGGDDNLGRADALYRDALNMRERMLGETHPDTITVMYNLVELHRARGMVDTASKLAEEIVARIDRLNASIEGAGGQ